MKGIITEIPLENSEKWNEIVRSFPNYEVFYLNEYAQAFAQENEQYGIPVLLHYSTNADSAINVVFKRDISFDEIMSSKIEKGLYYDLITPYGYGGFWGGISDWEELNRTYREYCIDKHYISEFVRFELFNDYFRHYDGVVKSRTHNVVRSLEMPIEELWMDFKQKVRKNVKKANSHNLSCIVENTGEYLEDFLRIYNGTMTRNSAERDFYFSRSFFEKLNEMKDNIMYFHVVYEDKIISTELVLYGAENCYSYLGGTDSKYFDYRPNDYLKYEVIKWAKNRGLKNFVLGGGYGSDDGIYQYKLCLAPHGIYDFYIGSNVFDKDVYSYLVDLRAEDNPACRESEFFPKYRA